MLTTKSTNMKSLKIYTYGITSLLTVVLFISCTKSFDEKTVQQKNFSGSTIAQVFIAMVGAAGNTVTVDAVPVTGNLFPTTGYGFALVPGVRAFTIAGTAPQVPITFAETMQPGKHHTIFIYDTITSPKQKTVVDNIVIPTDTSSRLRFANFIYNPFAVPAVDVYSFNRAVNLFTNVPVTGVTEYSAYPSRLPVDTFYIRETGTMNQLLKITITGGLTAKRNYTYVYRGSHRGTRTTTLFANY